MTLLERISDELNEYNTYKAQTVAPEKIRMQRKADLLKRLGYVVQFNYGKSEFIVNNINYFDGIEKIRFKYNPGMKDKWIEKYDKMKKTKERASGARGNPSDFLLMTDLIDSLPLEENAYENFMSELAKDVTVSFAKP